jgi:hypothetical protein
MFPRACTVRVTILHFFGLMQRVLWKTHSTMRIQTDGVGVRAYSLRKQNTGDRLYKAIPRTLK